VIPSQNPFIERFNVLNSQQKNRMSSFMLAIKLQVSQPQNSRFIIPVDKNPMTPLYRDTPAQRENVPDSE
jgi:hypothetical protein